MQVSISHINNILRELKYYKNSCQTAVPYLCAYRFTDSKIYMPQTNNPYLYIVLSGSMRLHTQSGIMDYVQGQYSVSATDTPQSAQVLTFSEENDFLALSVEFTLDDVISIVLDLENDFAERIINSQIQQHTMIRSDNAVIQSIERLLSIITEEERLSFMGTHIKREILFNALFGTCGKQFLQSIINIQQAGEIYEVNSWIKQNYKIPFTVDELASKLNMSVSAFHQKFKNAVGMGPLQCQKRLRLTEARRLMLDENKSVTEASIDVGYESLSQFIRDYRKMFNASPKEDIQTLSIITKKIGMCNFFAETGKHFSFVFLYNRIIKKRKENTYDFNRRIV